MKIIYTHTDEAPALATQSLLPIVRAYAATAGIELELRDISLSGRILASIGKQDDALAELGELAKTPAANIIKLPNISASVPQMKAAIKELQEQGHDIPDYEDARDQYDNAKGSAVNPVLREGNSDRRAPASVKAYAQKYPHSMGAWASDTKSHVVTMDDGDFRNSEVSTTVEADTTVRIEHVAEDGTVTVLKESTPLLAGEVLDCSRMDVAALRTFLEAQVAEAKAQGILFSVHLKATMMKVSDPIIFGHAIRAYFGSLLDEYPDFNPNDGLASLVSSHPDAQAKLDAAIEAGPDMAMVDSSRGITNLHVPSDVIIDASMPAAIRASGQMWNKDDAQQDTLYVIPDSSYAALYDETVKHCIANGAFDPATMGTTPNVGLMAQKAEEYGSHDKTFEAESAGTIRIVDAGSGDTLLEQSVGAGDIFRACQTKDAPIQDWIRLAVTRGRASSTPVVFWLDETRAHDAELLKKLKPALEEIDTDGVQIEIKDVREATRFTLERARKGEDTIAATGNVLRDYLTDLFPILELGTSAKMLSIVPLMNGGGLFETGAGGSAPKHVQQFNKENHLRWDSLGEFLALAVSLEMLGEKTDNPKAKLLADTLDRATGTFLEENKSPSRKCGELDNRGSHFYLGLYWAQELASQTDDTEVAERFKSFAEQLAAAEQTIVDELNAVQGEPCDVGGYFRPDVEKVADAMRPSKTLNDALASL